jgi:hypothetical protein
MATMQSEIIGIAIGVVLIVFLVYRMFSNDDSTPAAKRRPRWPIWRLRSGLLESSIDAHRADMIAGDKHLPRLKRVQTNQLNFLKALACLLGIPLSQDVPWPFDMIILIGSLTAALYFFYLIVFPHSTEDDDDLPPRTKRS